MHVKITYRDFEIYPSSVSYHPATDWTYTHKDYDGADDSNDLRYGHAGSVEEAKREIDAWYEENED